MSEKVKTFNIADAHDTLNLAKDVANFIQENNLAMPIQGKEHVNVEGWMYAGSRLGIVPIIESIDKIPCEGKEVKYQAYVKLLDLKSGQQVGSGFSICSNTEKGKGYYQEFAIASMAQTRAIGKAYRNLLAWIIRAAGYEPTPAEEMDFLGSEPLKSETKVQPKPEAKKEQAPKSEKTKLKTELLLLLNNAKITSSEKIKMIESLNSMDNERMTKAIDKIKSVISEREAEPARV